MTEIWLAIEGYGNRYEVSNSGRVRRIPFVDKNGRRFKGKELRTSVNKSLGYRMVCCEVDGKKHALYVHRLVANAFIKNTDGKKFVNHIDGDKSNSTVENLEWVTAKENAEHAIRLGLASVPENHPGEKCRAAKLTDMEVREIRKRIANSESHESIAKQFGVVKGTIGHIKRGTTWSAVR